MTPDMFDNIIKDERLVELRKGIKAQEKKMRKYTDNIPQDRYSKPDSRIPKELYETWLEANIKYENMVQRIMEEQTGGATKLNGIIWVYYRK